MIKLKIMGWKKTLSEHKPKPMCRQPENQHLGGHWMNPRPKTQPDMTNGLANTQEHSNQRRRQY